MTQALLFQASMGKGNGFRSCEVVTRQGGSAVRFRDKGHGRQGCQRTQAAPGTCC